MWNEILLPQFCRKNSVKSTCLLKNSTLNCIALMEKICVKLNFFLSRKFFPSNQFRVEFFSKQVDLTEFFLSSNQSTLKFFSKNSLSRIIFEKMVAVKFRILWKFAIHYYKPEVKPPLNAYRSISVLGSTFGSTLMKLLSYSKNVFRQRGLNLYISRCYFGISAIRALPSCD